MEPITTRIRFQSTSKPLKTRTLPSVAGFLLPQVNSCNIITYRHNDGTFDGSYTKPPHFVEKVTSPRG